MKVFVTGATGFVGSAVVKELDNRGHKVIGLARNESSANALLESGHQMHLGDIANPSTITPVLDEVDAVIHMAFNHDFSQYVDNCIKDGQLLDAMANALSGTNKTLIATSGTAVTIKNRIANEKDLGLPEAPRTASEDFLRYCKQGVQTSVIRLAPTVYGVGDKAFIPALIALAKQTGISAYISDGENRWPAVHRNDAARLFCDVLEQPLAGSRYHAVAEEGIAFRTIAEAIAKGLGIPTKSITDEQAEQHFGWLAMFAAMDMPASSQWTQSTTGWFPQEDDLINTMIKAGYFH